MSAKLPVAPAVSEKDIFARLVEEAQDAIARVSYRPKPHFSYVNDAQVQLTGYAKEDFYADVGLTFRIVHPDDKDKVLRMREGARGEPLVMRIVRKDGALRWVESRSWPILDADGKVIEVVSINRDITERVLAEEAARRGRVARKLAHIVLDELTRRAPLGDAARREIGRSIAQDVGPSATPDAFTSTFADMGLGELVMVQVEPGSWTVTGTGLLETLPGRRRPTCMLTLGFAEVAVALMEGRPALGAETRCASLGHPACTFVVRVRPDGVSQRPSTVDHQEAPGQSRKQ